MANNQGNRYLCVCVCVFLFCLFVCLFVFAFVFIANTNVIGDFVKTKVTRDFVWILLQKKTKVTGDFVAFIATPK